MATEPSFSVEREYWPVRMSQDDLVAFVNRIDSLATTANAGTTPEDIATELSLSDGRITATFTGSVTVETLASAPAVATDVKYSYSVFRGAPAVKRIDIRLTDVQRSVSVTGSSRDQVEAISNAGAAMLDTMSTMFGGLVFRMAAGFFLLIVGLAVTSLSSTVHTHS